MVMYKCRRCGHKFSRKSNYTRHVNNVNKCVYILEDIEINKTNFIIVDNDFKNTNIKKIVEPKIKLVLVSSKEQTKDWRKNQEWYINGKKNECEKEQIKCIEQFTKIKMEKTEIRLHKINFKMKNNRLTNKSNDFFYWTENFDCKFKFNNQNFYGNLKFVCDKGGAQNRTLSLVFDFIMYQLNYLLKNKTNDIFFFNILDGDGCYVYNEHFKSLLESLEYKEVLKHIFVGDMLTFSIYWSNKYSTIS
jgi:hypothetical protein